MNQEKNIFSNSRELQIFLVQRFLMVVVFLYVAQQLVNFLFRNVFLRIMTEVMEVGEIAGSGDKFIMVGEILLVAVVAAVTGSVPLVTQSILSRIDPERFRIAMHAPSFITKYGENMTKIYYIALVIIVVIQILVMISPYVLGGWWYIRIISQKMKELREYDNQQKMEYDRRRNLLFSDIVHDVKTPITTVSGYSRALLDGLIDDPEKEREYLTAINAKSLRISDLITMLFEFVKLDSEGFTLHQQSYDLAELVRENVIMLFADFEDKGLELDIDIPDESCMAYVDRIQMSRVVTNLLTNTIRYLKAGDLVKVSLEIIPSMDPDDASAGSYKISVADDGIAIDDKLVDNIFDPFTRADSARNTVSGGSGLGLSIAHKIASMHGGKLVLNQPCGDDFTKAFEIYVPMLRENRNDE